MTGNGRNHRRIITYPLTCGLCEEIFTTKMELREHKRDEHAY